VVERQNHPFKLSSNRSSKVGLQGSHAAWRTLVTLLVISGVALGALAVLNIAGWRARILSRLFRTENRPLIVAPPASFRPEVPLGFKVSVFARGFAQPRWMAVAPDGDIFVADSSAGEVVILHAAAGQPAAEPREVFADHLNLPFGIAFHNDYAYVADTDEVLRFRYDPRNSRRLSNPERILHLPGGGYNQHWTRSLAFSPDGKRMFVSVGSRTNVSIESDPRRGAILVSDPDGRNMRVYAAGLRNAVGIGFSSESTNLWATVNERDNTGEDVPSDYFTHVVEGGFYGWPYSYLGQHLDNRVAPRPELVAKAIVPDMLLGAHVAPLQFVFYGGHQFPNAYWGGAFIAEHGSWNRRLKSGYQVVFIPFRAGVPAGAPLPFFSGFVPALAGKVVYGRATGLAVAPDGSLLISDDGGNLIWRVSYEPSAERN
jgi:glucose/arabinose dehydrogenase